MRVLFIYELFQVSIFWPHKNILLLIHHITNTILNSKSLDKQTIFLFSIYSATYYLKFVFLVLGRLISWGGLFIKPARSRLNDKNYFNWFQILQLVINQLLWFGPGKKRNNSKILSTVSDILWKLEKLLPYGRLLLAPAEGCYNGAHWAQFYVFLLRKISVTKNFWPKKCVAEKLSCRKKVSGRLQVASDRW